MFVSCLNLKDFFCFLWNLLGGSSVCWWCIRLICAAWGSLATCFICFAVALELSIFLASCLTLLAGNLLSSILLSLIVFETNSSSQRKNQKTSLCRILAVSCGYLANATCVYTALYHSSTDFAPCLKLVSKSNLALTSLDWGLQNYSNFPHISSRVSSSLVKFRDTYWSIPNIYSRQAPSCIFFSPQALQAHTPISFLHFNLHFKNLWYRPSLTIQSILGPSI